MIVVVKGHGTYKVVLRLCWADELPEFCRHLAGATELCTLDDLDASAIKAMRCQYGRYKAESMADFMELLTVCTTVARSNYASGLYKAVRLEIELI